VARDVEDEFNLTDGIPAARIGELLTLTRVKAGFEQRDIAKAVGANARRVRRWEEGNEIPSDTAITLFVAACGSSLDELLPPRDHVEFDPSSLLMRVGDSVVSIVEPDNEIVLTTYLRLVRHQRGLWPEDTVHLRKSDIDLLSRTLDLRDQTLEQRLVAHVGLSPEAAAELRFKLIKRRHPSAG
jgi:transcriptional regulator with XRE-family HTH domain